MHQWLFHSYHKCLPIPLEVNKRTRFTSMPLIWQMMAAGEEGEEGSMSGGGWQRGGGLQASHNVMSRLDSVLLRQLFDPTHGDTLGALDREAKGSVPNQL